MQIKAVLKKLWRRSRWIRPAFWWCYERRPAALRDKAEMNRWLDHVLPELYGKKAKEPVDERLALFVEPRFKEMNSSLRIVYDRMKEDPRFDVRFFCLDSLGKTQKENLRKSRTLISQAACAKYIFCSDACAYLGCVRMRSETVYVQLWHACGAFKGFGMSTVDHKYGFSYKDLVRHPAYANTDIVTVSSREIRWAYAQAMALPEDRIYDTGVSRTDLYFSEDNLKAAKERLYAFFPEAKGKKVILYAPTFRGHVKDAQTALAFRPEILAGILGEGYVLVTKHHPFVKELPVLPASLDGTFIRDASGSMNMEDLLMAADLCITDYSSIVFEYSLLDRPILFYAYDLEEYDDWRGFYYPYEELTPGPVCRTNEELAEKIRSAGEWFDKDELAAFRERFMSACDGHATDRIIRLAVEKGSLRPGVRRAAGQPCKE